MKRSGPPRRRTPLNPGTAPLGRRAPLRAGQGLTRSGPIRPVSPARADRRNGRQAVVEASVAAARGLCALYRPGECRTPTGVVWRPGDPLDGHEVARRSQLPGSELVPELVLPVCRHHHTLDVRLRVGEAVGLRARRQAWIRWPWSVVLDELEQRRARYRATGEWEQVPPPPWVDEAPGGTWGDR